MFIQADDAILNVNHIVEVLSPCGETTYEDTQETILRFKVQGYDYGFTKPDTDQPFMLAVMVNGSKHLVLSAAIHNAVMPQSIANPLDEIRKSIAQQVMHDDVFAAQEEIIDLSRTCNCGSNDHWAECQVGSIYCG